jgi:hypothetical protein
MDDIIQPDPIDPLPVEDPIIEDLPKKEKKKYVLSPLRLEALAKAREKAMTLRKEYHATKEPVKKEREKHKSKLEIKLENIALKKQIDETPVKHETPVTPDKHETPVTPVTPDKHETPVTPVILKKRDVRPSFIKNENGFFCL